MRFLIVCIASVWPWVSNANPKFDVSAEIQVEARKLKRSTSAPASASEERAPAERKKVEPRRRAPSSVGLFNGYMRQNNLENQAPVEQNAFEEIRAPESKPSAPAAPKGDI